MADPTRLRPLLEPERSALQLRFLEADAAPAEAFTAEARARSVWLDRLAALDGPDRRPGRVARYWEERNQRADFGPTLRIRP